MKTLREKVAYIRGIADGMELDRDNPQSKLLLQTLELLQEMVAEIDDLVDRVGDNEDLLEALDSDLADVEEYIFADDEDVCCEDEDDDLNEFEIQCPHCDEIVYVDEEDLEDIADDGVEILCPNCDKVIFSDDDEEEQEQDPPAPVD